LALGMVYEKEFKSRQMTVDTAEIVMNSESTDLLTLVKNNQSYKIATQLTANFEEKLTVSTNVLVLNIHRYHPIIPKHIPFLNDTYI
jgi:hypothetical protein